MSPHDFYHRIIAGRKPGVGAWAVRTVLRPLSWIYEGITSLRNLCFDCGLKQVHRAGVPVISVGNLTTGGTGKTPMVATVIGLLQNVGHQPGIVSRGYGADDSGCNDEKRVLEHLCPQVPHVQDPDRVAAAFRITADEPIDVIVLDDGLQHRHLHRDLNLVLIDATNPFGHGFLLPRGLLRESMTGIRRADCVIITRCDQVAGERLTEIRSRLRHILDGTACSLLQVRFRPTGLLTEAATSLPLTDIVDQRVMLVAAIGNPQGFVETCRSAGANIVWTRFFADHYHYTPADLRSMVKEAKAHQAESILTTVKDFVKIRPLLSAAGLTGGPQIRALEISTVFDSAESEQELLALVCERCRSAEANRGTSI